MYPKKIGGFNLKIQKIFIALTAAITVLNTGVEAFAAENNVQSVADQDLSNSVTQDVIVSGQAIAKQKITTLYSRAVKNEEIVVNVTVSTHYFDINSEAAEDVDLQDNSNTYTIEKTKDGEYIVNGKKLTNKELSQPVAMDSQPQIDSFSTSAVAASDNGGIPAISHYYGNYTTYTLSTYSELSATLKASGSHIQATGNINNSYVSNAKSAIDSFSSSYNTMWASINAAGIAAAGGAVTVETIIGAIVAGGAVATAATTAYNSYKNCNTQLSKAYNYIAKI